LNYKSAKADIFAWRSIQMRWLHTVALATFALLTLTVAIAECSVFQSDRFTVYVSAPMRGGFVDTSKDVQDSIKDIRGQLQDVKQIQVVDAKERADIVLTVISRGAGSEKYGERLTYNEYFNTAELSSTPIVKTTLWVSTVMQVGDYKKEFTGTDTAIPEVTMALWSKCAKQIAKNLEAWVKANATQLKQVRSR